MYYKCYFGFSFLVFSVYVMQRYKYYLERQRIIRKTVTILISYFLLSYFLLYFILFKEKK